MEPDARRRLSREIVIRNCRLGKMARNTLMDEG
jgi:hypothetical protein